MVDDPKSHLLSVTHTILFIAPLIVIVLLPTLVVAFPITIWLTPEPDGWDEAPINIQPLNTVVVLPADAPTTVLLLFAPVNIDAACDPIIVLLLPLVHSGATL